MKHRVMYLSGQREGLVVMDDGTLRMLPDNALDHGLINLLDRVSARMSSDATLVLDGAAAARLGMHDVRPVTEEGMATASREGGWAITSREAGWTKALRYEIPSNGRPRTYAQALRLVEMDLIDHARQPLLRSDWPSDVVDSLAMWHAQTGTAWEGTPGVTGMILLRRLLGPHRVNHRPTDQGPCSTPGRAYERPWEDQDAWRRPPTERYSHSYDRVRAYLNAMAGCEYYAAAGLRPTPRAEPDPALAGWWHVSLTPWTGDLAELLPHPAGPGPINRWITTPRLLLLQQLYDQGLYGGFDIMDAYTAPAVRLFRGWAELLDETWRHNVARSWDDGDLHTADYLRMAAAVKEVYRESYGMFNHESNSFYRPDWHYTTIAQNAVNVWRTALQIGQREGRWPSQIRAADTITYDSNDPNPYSAAPQGLRGLGDPDPRPDTEPLTRLGHWTVKTSMENPMQQVLA